MNSSEYYEHVENIESSESLAVKSSYPLCVKTVSTVTTTINFWPLGLGLLIVCILGLIGNIFSAIVLARPKMKSTYSILTLGLTLCDSIYLLTKLLRYGLTSLFDTLMIATYYNHFLYPLFGPQLRALTFTAQTGSTYFTVALAVDRYVSVCWPIHAKTVCTKRRAQMIAAGVIIFSIIYNIPRWFEMQTCLNSNATQAYRMGTAALRKNPVYQKYYIFWTYFFMINCIPFSSLIFFNFKIFDVVRTSNRARQSMTSTQRRDISFAMMLLTIVAAYLLSNLIYFVTDVISYLGISYASFWDSMGNFLLTVNSAINFLIYCAFGRKFRREFRNALKETFRRRSVQDHFGSSSQGTPHSVSAKRTGRTLKTVLGHSTEIKKSSPPPDSRAKTDAV